MNNFIEIYSNRLPAYWCEEVIKLFNDYDSKGLTTNRQRQDKVSTLEKEDDILFCNWYDIRPHYYNFFNEALWKAYNEYANKYGILKECGHHHTYQMKIQKIKQGQGYHTWHSEAMDRESCHRVLAWTCYLNDTFEAGETEFLYQNMRYKPHQGDIVLFPAAFTHVHRGNPPINGTKYIITGWIEY
jgi:hypothetical protein